MIKTHFFFFYLNECKLAHLLWWASCPDSSISMIDQLSSCWWRSGNGGCSGDGCGGDEGRRRRRRREGMRDKRAERRGWRVEGGGVRKWSETVVLQISFFLSLFDSIRRNAAVVIRCFVGLSPLFPLVIGSNK